MVRKGERLPNYEGLYDCARKLGYVELVIETRPRARRYPLRLAIRHTSSGDVVHEAVVREGIEQAAGELRRRIERLAGQGKRSAMSETDDPQRQDPQ